MLKVFDFKCTKCNNIVELFVKDNNPQICKNCGITMIKLLTNVGMIRGNFADKARIK